VQSRYGEFNSLCRVAMFSHAAPQDGCHVLHLTFFNSFWRVELVVCELAFKISGLSGVFLLCARCGELARFWFAVGMLKARNPGTFWSFFVVASSTRCGELNFAFLMVSLVLACIFLHKWVE